MMVAPFGLPAATPAPRETVYDAVAGWARRANRARLAVWTIGGTVNTVGIALVLPGWWPLAAFHTCIASIGAWGLAAQRLRTLDATHAPARFQYRALRAAEIAAVMVGTVAAVVAFYGAFLMLLGRRWGPSGG
jgi:hypothetical protein